MIVVHFFFAAIQFQENLLKTMIQIENTFFTLAESFNRDCIVICDRGTMDPSACKSIHLLIAFIYWFVNVCLLIGQLQGSTDLHLKWTDKESLLAFQKKLDSKTISSN